MDRAPGYRLKSETGFRVTYLGNLPLPELPVAAVYSSRSTRTGSSRSARMTGNALAPMAAITNASAANENDCASWG